MTDKIRVNKFIADAGICSRREADKLIDTGRVTVNNELPEPGMKVSASDKIVVDGKLISKHATKQIKKVYIAYHKPRGITCTTDQRIKGNIIDAINFDQRIFPVGRLDKLSEGLILLTNDGEIVNKILKSHEKNEKEYNVKVDQPIQQATLFSMAQGVEIGDNEVTKPCYIEKYGSNAFTVVLTQGLNRQIRRMCEHFELKVKRLQRFRVMHITLKGIKAGEWRHLTKDEVNQMMKALSLDTRY